MEKILITGSNGILGQIALILFNLKNNPIEVMGLDIPAFDFSNKNKFDLLNSYS